MKLVKCANCGQSINPKRDACPFCNAAVVKGGQTPSRPVPVNPQSASPATPEAPGSSGEATSLAATVVSQPPLWKRLKVIIPIAAGIVVVALLLAAGVAASVITADAPKSRIAPS